MESELIRKSETSIQNTELNERAIESTEKLISILIKIIMFCEEHKLCNNVLQKTLYRLEVYYHMIINLYRLQVTPGSIAYTNHELIIQTQLFIYKYEGDINNITVNIDEISRVNILCLYILENAFHTKDTFMISNLSKKFQFLANQIRKELP